MQTKTIIKNIEIEPKKLKIQLELVFEPDQENEESEIKYSVNIIGDEYGIFKAEAYGYFSDSLSSPKDAIENLIERFRNIIFPLKNISNKKHEEMEDIVKLYKKIK